MSPYTRLEIIPESLVHSNSAPDKTNQICTYGACNHCVSFLKLTQLSSMTKIWHVNLYVRNYIYTFKNKTLFSLLLLLLLSRFSSVWLFVTLWTIAHQAPPSIEFSRQEYWSGLPFPSPGVFLTQGLNPSLLHCRKILYHWATREAL